MAEDKKIQTEAIVDALMSDPARRVGHHFIQNVDMDKVVAALLRITMEISVLRDRIDTHESLAQKSGAYTRDDVESYKPTSTEEAARNERRQHLISRLARDLS